MSPEVINCLKNEMCIYWSHFDSKYKYFVGQDKLLVDEKLLTMFRLSSAIKSGEEKSA